MKLEDLMRSGCNLTMEDYFDWLSKGNGEALDYFEFWMAAVAKAC